MQVDSAWSSGNHEQARSHSNIAKIINIIGIVIGSLCWIGVAAGVIYSIVITVSVGATVNIVTS